MCTGYTMSTQSGEPTLPGRCSAATPVMRLMTHSRAATQSVEPARYCSPHHRTALEGARRRLWFLKRIGVGPTHAGIADLSSCILCKEKAWQLTQFMRGRG